MKASLFICGISAILFGLSSGQIDEDSRAQHHHGKSHNVHKRSHDKNHREHFLHFGRHHKGIKARNGNSTVCLSICQFELAAVSKWLNNSNELNLLYEIIPPSVKSAIFNDLNATYPNVSDPNNSNVTIFNGSLSVNLNFFYDAAAEWPILTYIAKLIGYFLSRAHGMMELFNIFPSFSNVWRTVLRGLTSGCDQTENLINNLRDLFGFNGSFSSNLFNATYWENLPTGWVHQFEHAVEGGLESLANLTSAFAG